MRRSLLLKLLLSFSLLPVLAPLQAQVDFAYRSQLATVEEAAFYKIILQPEIVAKCRESLQDVRILDQQNKQVPYILQTGTRLLPIPPPAIEQKDSSDNATYITIRLNDDYIIDSLAILVEGTRYYKRSVAVTAGNSWARGFSIRSGAHALFPLEVKTRQFLLVIQNGDSPPLQVSTVKLWQTEKYLLSYLETGTRYDLMFGNPAVASPRYDLAFFRDSIRNEAKLLTSGPIIPNKAGAGIKKRANENSAYSWVLWVVIVAVLLLLLAITLQMTKEVNRKSRGAE